MKAKNRTREGIVNEAITTRLHELPKAEQEMIYEAELDLRYGISVKGFGQTTALVVLWSLGRLLNERRFQNGNRR